MRKQDIYILGLNYVYHESSACLVKNGELVAFIEEERLNRVRHAKPARIDNAGELPLRSIDYCLKEAGITHAQVDYVAQNLLPQDRLEKMQGKDSGHATLPQEWGTLEGEKLFYENNVRSIAELSRRWGRDLTEHFYHVKHHLAHAAGAFYSSDFPSAAILGIDGIAESNSTWVGVGKDTKLENYYEIDYPNSLGFLWEKMSEFLGFSEYDAEKVMGLASYGDYKAELAQMVQLVDSSPKTTFMINNDILLFRTGDFSALEKLFGIKRRQKDETLTKQHQNIAAAMQYVTQEIFVNLAREVKRLSGGERLCMAGGTTLNVVANGCVAQENLFDEIYIQPAANDAGGSLGAAFYLWADILKKGRPAPVPTAYLGPEFSNEQIERVLKNEPRINYQKVTDLTGQAAGFLAEGKLVAWFQGRMEAGPRALGHRSLLADPRRTDMFDLINLKVKKREYFRPLAPSVLAEQADEWFEVPERLPDPTKYMLMTFSVKPEQRDKIPAVVHVDGTSRIHAVHRDASPRYWELISEFNKLTGIPMVLNTSLNIQEPIVCTPEDAIKTFLRSKIDYLCIGDYICQRN